MANSWFLKTLFGSAKVSTLHRWPAATRWWHMYDLARNSFYN